MKAKFSIKVTQRNMYNFMMYYAYHGVSGIFSIVAAAALLGLAVWSGTHGGENTWLYALFGVLFAVYQPWTSQSIFVSTGKRNAFIWVKSQLGNNEKAVRNLLTAQVPESRRKLKAK